MRVGPPDARAGKASAFDDLEHLFVGHYRRGRQFSQKSQNFRPALQVAQRNLANDEWVHDNLPQIEETRETGVPSSQVLDPHRGIDEDHRCGRAGRRLRTGFSAGSRPPNAASRRALSRAIKALSPS